MISHFSFEWIVLQADPTRDDSLRFFSEVSELYPVDEPKSVCVLRLSISDKPWVAVLRVRCMEGNYEAIHPKLYALKVLKAGGVHNASSLEAAEQF